MNSLDEWVLAELENCYSIHGLFLKSLLDEIAGCFVTNSTQLYFIRQLNKIDCTIRTRSLGQLMSKGMDSVIIS